ncbi:uncharacterized protein N7498_010759 [Penicillium cinerascens]|uniref:Uncharacterized protein n=1 Tax=Penicillium cinerascens TaxID=70096 RepID=A0A9W9J751_9EURO|nr:uncharacterized protein N7498_010759 [Penicillium cinerascens]KAJ5191774.1 hypothetical protein N7498_010759 [Penicillium cinerascens]
MAISVTQTVVVASLVAFVALTGIFCYHFVPHPDIRGATAGETARNYWAWIITRPKFLCCRRQTAELTLFRQQDPEHHAADATKPMVSITTIPVADATKPRVPTNTVPATDDTTSRDHTNFAQSTAATKSTPSVTADATTQTDARPPSTPWFVKTSGDRGSFPVRYIDMPPGATLLGEGSTSVAPANQATTDNRFENLGRAMVNMGTMLGVAL